MVKTLAQTEVLKLESSKAGKGLRSLGGKRFLPWIRECNPASEARILAHVTDGQCK